MPLLTIFAGGGVGPRERPAIGYRTVEVLEGGDLLNGLGSSAEIHEHHSCDVATLPDEFEVLAYSNDCAVEAGSVAQTLLVGHAVSSGALQHAAASGALIVRNFFALTGVGRQQGSPEREAQSG